MRALKKSNRQTLSEKITINQDGHSLVITMHPKVKKDFIEFCEKELQRKLKRGELQKIILSCYKDWNYLSPITSFEEILNHLGSSVATERFRGIMISLLLEGLSSFPETKKLMVNLAKGIK